ncbi:hypothetical protein L6164_024487 [Bauhinia variegata]|uniref:Uncharacterized protein n=1 Tax=Bauhinia variegata TaxID=167791 RepID=A0ACB9LXN0_BAUVA|nr:hypothetical protein L6164_024487 [Bauhinia variegata]
MEDYSGSRSYGNGQMMQMESYYGSSAPRRYDLRCYSASYAQTQVGLGPIPNPNELKLKKGKGSTRFSLSKSMSLNDPEFQRRKRVAGYKMYTVEGKVKGSLRKSFRWIKNRYSQVVYGWW